MNESKKSANLLIKNSLPLFKKPFWLKTNNLKSRNWPQKNSFEKYLIVKSIEDAKTSKKTHIEDIAIEKDNKNELIQAIV